MEFLKRNLANTITLFRLLLLPPLAVLILRAGEDSTSRHVGLFLFAMAGLSDFADGQVARRLNIVSELGKVMDPLADRLLSVTVLVCLTVAGLLPLWMALLIVAREALMILGAPLYGLFDPEGKANIEVHWTGKLATACLLVFVGFVLLLGKRNEVPGASLVFFLPGIIYSYASGYIYIERFLFRVRRGPEERRT